MPARILVVDDDPDVALGVQVALELDGHAVTLAGDGHGALRMVAGSNPDAIVLDVAMPGMDGHAVCRTLRAAGDRTPVLLLTARDRTADRVAGLDSGADDHLGKPFDLDELRARVRALLRRSLPSDRSPTWRGMRLDDAERVLVVSGSPTGRVPLTRIETLLLGAFFEEPLRTRSRDELSDRIWDDGDCPTSNALEVYIAQLRRKLERATGSRSIVTVRGLGYRLES